MLNGFFVAVFSLLVGSALVGVEIPGSAWPSLLLVTLVSVFACTGFGLLAAAWGLLIQDQAVLANVLVGILLVFSGANAPIDALPGWLQTLSHGLPFRHGIEAARRLADGESLGAVTGLVTAELAVGLVYAALGYLAIRRVEVLSRRRATLERA
jgi:ABC-2 type transport system permease protein